MASQITLNWQALYDQKALLLDYLQHERQSMFGWDWRTRMAILEAMIELFDWLLSKYGKPVVIDWDKGSGPP